LIRDAVAPERIVAYAKVEKEFPIGNEKLSDSQTKQVHKFVNNNLEFATQFSDPEDNVLLRKEDGKHQIRVSFNKEKITGRQQEVESFFDQFSSMQQLVEAAQAELSPNLQTASPLSSPPRTDVEMTDAEVGSKPLRRSERRASAFASKALLSQHPASPRNPGPPGGPLSSLQQAGAPTTPGSAQQAPPSSSTRRILRSAFTYPKKGADRLRKAFRRRK
jgi:hypothetical protein